MSSLDSLAILLARMILAEQDDEWQDGRREAGPPTDCTSPTAQLRSY